MPIDDNLIQTTVETLRSKEAELTKKISQIRVAYNGLIEIQIEKIRKSNNTGGFDIVNEDPRDRLLGTKMTQPRRQEIYDKVMADATALMI